jgi:DNA topoisomerase 2-associated protein PAT1
MMQLSLSVDDMYVWQFLAAMAVGASMDQQHILVTEVR